MTTLLLTTKLYVPPPRTDLVLRPRLIERLNAGLHRKLTLVSAPAGFGKTTLLSEWVAGCRRAVAWLSLDESDNDPVRFLTYFLVALQRVDPNIGQAAQAMLQAPQPPPPETLLTSLINDIAATPQPFALVLDDYHLIRTLPIHQQLAFLLEHQPPSMHLVIATREDPPLPLSRLRARGHTVDVRQDDLRFTAEEAADFLRRVMRIELSSTDLTALHRRTEGWIAGLQLAALSLQGRDDAHQIVQSFTGSHRYILDYLTDEVLQQRPKGTKGFLLQASILDRLSGPLCDAVTGQTDGQATLERLEQANLFIVPLDDERRWYRYHRLFADLLRHRLHRAHRDLVPELHHRASQWYEAAGFPADAVNHALAGSDWGRAATLILGVGESMLKRGEVVTLLGWFQALPDEVVFANPQLCMEYSWPLILTEQIDAAEPYLAQAEQVALEHEIMPLLGEIAIVKAYIARLRGDNAQVIELSEQALSLLPKDDLSGRSIVAMNLGMAQWFRGRIQEAEQALLEAQRAGRGSRNEYVRWTAVLFLSRIQTARGKSRQAAASYRQIIEQGRQLPIVGLAYYDLGRLSYEWDDLAAAADYLQHGIEIVQRGGNVEFEVGGYSALAFVKQAQGDSAAAQDALRRADQLLENPSTPPSTRLYNLAARAAVALGQSDLDAASRVVERFPGPEKAGSFPDVLLLMLAQARLLLMQGQQAAAAGLLEALYNMAFQAGWQSTVTQARALQALAAPTPEQALNFLAEALTYAESENYVRTFVDAGEPMAELLRQAKSQGVATEYVNKLLAAFDAPKTLAPKPAVAQPLIEPLSDREIDVLHFLADGQTNQEIAQALCVSINTVKTHLKNVYGKLGVSNRREATAEAKKLGLVA
ncbi:MAG: LuxR C-terminal-related transcriptional regulator [Chloroflexota bacterium]|nr:LuxR C-terminal-related transcriptional regulator [Chloroflexota bacterium]